MDPAPLIAAGSLQLLAAAVHGLGGELLVVRKLVLDVLPSSRFGGARMTKAMIHVSWHITTVAFLAVGGALLAAGTALDGEAAEAVAIFAAASAAGFAVIAVGVGGAYLGSPRSLLRHPGPLGLSSVAVLAWVGAL